MMGGTMKTYTFWTVLDRDPTTDNLEGLFNASCDDASFGIEKGHWIGEFDREAESEGQAVKSAIEDLKKAGFQVITWVNNLDELRKKQ
jgi:hypothetical protein